MEIRRARFQGTTSASDDLRASLFESTYVLEQAIKLNKVVGIRDVLTSDGLVVRR